MKGKRRKGLKKDVASPAICSASARSTSGLDFELTYLGKKSEQSILSRPLSVRLVEVDHWGPPSRRNKRNQLIRGENFEVLRVLLADRSVRGKVQTVYIDPPFSTQQEFRIGASRVSTVSSRNGDPIAYKDHLSGPEYIEFLRERFILLRELMATSGSIFVHIDYKIGHYVKVLMDEIFGVDNFRNDIARIKCNPKNFARRGFGNIKDLVLFYSKTGQFVWNDPRQPMDDEEIIRLFPRIDEHGRRYTTNPLHAPGETSNGDTGRVWQGLKPPPGRHWRVAREELDRLERVGLIEWSSTGNPRKKIFADEIATRGKRIQDVWMLKDPPYPDYPTEKNIGVPERVILATSNPGDLVLDCFSGSGTTLIAAEKLHRGWLGIDSSGAAIRTIHKRLKTLSQFSGCVYSETKSLEAN